MDTNTFSMWKRTSVRAAKTQEYCRAKTSQFLNKSPAFLIVVADGESANRKLQRQFRRRVDSESRDAQAKLITAGTVPTGMNTSTGTWPDNLQSNQLHPLPAAVSRAENVARSCRGSQWRSGQEGGTDVTSLELSADFRQKSTHIDSHYGLSLCTDIWFTQMARVAIISDLEQLGSSGSLRAWPARDHSPFCPPVMMATRPGAASPSPKPPTPSPSPSPAHDAEAMCRYPSKKCWNLRALKRNGERHNLCDLHRQKANKNQRRLELKRKTRAQASGPEPAGKRLRKKTRQRARRAPLSAHLAMKEEARARQQAAKVSSAGLTGWFLQDLGLLDGGHFAGFQAKDAQLQELQRLPDAVDEEVLDHILQDGQGDASKSLDCTGLEALAALPEGKTSPVDVGETWDNLDFSDYWLTPMPADQPAPSFDASAFVVDEDVFVADV